MIQFKDLLELAESRRTAKQYNPNKEITKKDLKKIFQITNTSPTSMGIENWRVINIRRDSKYKKEIVNFFKDSNIEKAFMASDLSLFITKKEDYFNKNNEELKEKAKKIIKHSLESQGQKFQDGFETSFFNSILLGNHGHNNNNREEWDARQAYIAIAFMCLGAKSLNIDSTIMEGFKIEINDYLFSKKLLKKDEQVTLSVALGYTSNVRKKFISKKQFRVPIDKKFKNI